MKFLTISELKDTASTIPPSMMRSLIEATLDSVNQEMKAGRILEVYQIAGSARTMVISEAKSAEEIIQSISAMPLAGLMDLETYPLADFNVAMKTFIEMMKKAEEMFPSPPK